MSPLQKLKPSFETGCAWSGCGSAHIMKRWYIFCGWIWVKFKLKFSWLCRIKRGEMGQTIWTTRNFVLLCSLKSVLERERSTSVRSYQFSVTSWRHEIWSDVVTNHFTSASATQTSVTLLYHVEHLPKRKLHGAFCSNIRRQSATSSHVYPADRTSSFSWGPWTHTQDDSKRIFLAWHYHLWSPDQHWVLLIADVRRNTCSHCDQHQTIETIFKDKRSKSVLAIPWCKSHIKAPPQLVVCM